MKLNACATRILVASILMAQFELKDVVCDATAYASVFAAPSQQTLPLHDCSIFLYTYNKKLKSHQFQCYEA